MRKSKTHLIIQADILLSADAQLTAGKNSQVLK